MLPYIIVKIGGAAITDKTRIRTLKEDRLDNIVTKLASVNLVESRLIVVHGAGSFGHFEAKKHSLASSKWPVSSDTEKGYGFATCRASLTALHSIVLNSLVARGIPAITITAFEHPDDYVDRAVKLAADGVFVPVLHGDVTLTADGTDVISGDDITLRIVRRLESRKLATRTRVIFITGIDGVYTAPPSHSSHAAKLIHLLKVKGTACEATLVNIEKEKSLIRQFTPDMLATSTAENDVTGGMRTKLASILSHFVEPGTQDLAMNTTISIVGATDSALLDALLNQASKIDSANMKGTHISLCT